MEFQAAQPQKQTPMLDRAARWTTPQREFLKINFDIVFTDDDRAGIGVII